MTKNVELKIYRDLSGANEKWATAIRKLLASHKVTMLNLIGSPGAGKTLLLECTFRKLSGKLRLAVLEGDVATTRDAERLAKLNCKVSQLLTDGGCHLSAKMIHTALLDLPLDQLDLIIVENVGNLVCPAEFDIGEDAKIAVLSVNEGEDKPIKYPKLFREAKAVVLTKIDLLPHIDYDLQTCLNFIHQVNAPIPVFQVSSTEGTGIGMWVKWLRDKLVP